MVEYKRRAETGGGLGICNKRQQDQPLLTPAGLESKLAHHHTQSSHATGGEDFTLLLRNDKKILIT